MFHIMRPRSPCIERVHHNALNKLFSTLPFNIYSEDVNIPLDVMIAFFDMSNAMSNMNHYLYVIDSRQNSSPLNKIYNINDYTTRFREYGSRYQEAKNKFLNKISMYPYLEAEPFFRIIEIETTLEKLHREAIQKWMSAHMYADEIVKIYPELNKSELLE